MSDYMKEAERLMLAVLEKTPEAIAVHRAALLAHIQRGAVPDQFRDATKMIEQAEVPMPDIKAHLLYCSAPKTAFRTVWKDGIDIEVPAHWVEHFCSRYGDAREAAGYARGWKEKYENPWQDGYTSGYNDGVQDGIRTAALRGEVKP